MVFICIFYPFDTVKIKVAFKYLNRENSRTIEMENEGGERKPQRNHRGNGWSPRHCSKTN